MYTKYKYTLKKILKCVTKTLIWTQLHGDLTSRASYRYILISKKMLKSLTSVVHEGFFSNHIECPHFRIPYLRVLKQNLAKR